MKQSSLMSFLETVLSTLIGLAVALLTQIVVFPWFGFNPSLHDNIMITGIFTIVSIVRQFGVRRLFEFLHIRRPLSPFMQAVIAERFRQVEVEGWSLDHDDTHKSGELATAAAAYALQSSMWELYPDSTSRIPPLMPTFWPWARGWWKPAGFRRDLVKAAALILAEGERFDRTKRSRSAPNRENALTQAKPEASPESNPGAA